MGLWARLTRWYARKREQAFPESDPAEKIIFSLLTPRGVFPGWTGLGERRTNPRPVETIAGYSPLQLGGIADLGAGVDLGPVTEIAPLSIRKPGRLSPAPCGTLSPQWMCPAVSFDTPAPPDVPQPYTVDQKTTARRMAAPRGRLPKADDYYSHAQTAALKRTSDGRVARYQRMKRPIPRSWASVTAKDCLGSHAVYARRACNRRDE